MLTCPSALSQIPTQLWSGRTRRKMLLSAGIDSLYFVTWLDPSAGRPCQGHALGSVSDCILGSGPFSIIRKNYTLSIMKKSTSQKEWGTKSSPWGEGCLRPLPRSQVGWSLQLLKLKKLDGIKMKMFGWALLKVELSMRQVRFQLDPDVWVSCCLGCSMWLRLWCFLAWVMLL